MAPSRSGPAENGALLSITINKPLAITTAAALATGSAGARYTQTFTATGGVTPYNWSLTGTLPAGLSFSAGVLSGTPTQVGTFPISVQVTDAGGSYLGADVAAEPNGDVYVVWWDYADNRIEGDKCPAASDCSLAASWGTDHPIDNLDSTFPPGSDPASNTFHTVTACRAPCNRSTGIAYPIANSPVSFDSGELGYNYTPWNSPASDRATWTTPKNLKPGTYTYFCRIHPFMRGAFRVAG